MSDPTPLSRRADPPAEPALPSAHLELTWRPLAEADVPALRRLVRRIEARDRPVTRATDVEIALYVTGSGPGEVRDAVGGFDAQGDLRAWAGAFLPDAWQRVARVFLFGGVDPAWRARGIGRALLAWQEGRARQFLAALDTLAPARLVAFTETEAEDRRRLLLAAGFNPRRWFVKMTRPTRPPIDAPLPAGLTVVVPGPEHAEAVRLVHNTAFADHWGSEPWAAPAWESHWAGLRLDLSRLALDDRGDVIGHALSTHDEAEPTEAVVDQLGVLRAHRGRGVASALLSAVDDAAREAGMDRLALDVDSENPTGAHRLYTHLGFLPSRGSIMYTVEL